MSNTQPEEMRTIYNVDYFLKRLNHYNHMIQLFESDDYRNNFENNDESLGKIIHLFINPKPGTKPKPKPKRSFSEAMGYDNDYHV
jgi:hypothetical protein